MRRAMNIVLFGAFAMCVSLSPLGLRGTVYAQNTPPQPDTSYVIGKGDQLEVNVWNHPELSKQIRVRPDGMISMPLIGDVKAAGQTPMHLGDSVRQALLYYLKEPRVSVIVIDYSSKKILVIGEVAKQGSYQYEGAMTAFDAIGAAGGYKKHAELKSILVVHDGYSKQPHFELANLHYAMHDATMVGNVALMPGDIVFVPQNFIGNMGDFLDYWMTRIRPAADTILLYDISRNNN
jgi:polysaccharide biosynthesis/export protein